MKFASDQQKELFQALEHCGEMVFACGSKGISANLVGKFTVRQNHKGEDQLNVDDGTHHVHIDWSRVKQVKIGSFHDEGLLTFLDGEETLFRLYLLSGPFPASVEKLTGNLI